MEITMNSFKEFELGFKIMMIGSPFYFLMAMDGMGQFFAFSYNLEYTNFLPFWASIPIAFSFIIGFILIFTTKENDENV